MATGLGTVINKKNLNLVFELLQEKYLNDPLEKKSKQRNKLKTLMSTSYYKPEKHDSQINMLQPQLESRELKGTSHRTKTKYST